ncbi:MAG: hypothetical protein RMI94_02420, partial [Bryobacterales bacterium]|nr:hypothetical protein [Bryobacteraceae bacterium]MDW8129374.1 hypothetical protein [Bryobacterales bacterium]
MPSSFRLLASVCVGALLAQQPQGLTREDGYWTQGVSGTAETAGARRLRVSTRGDIRLNGEERKGIAWRMIKRVRVGQESAARRLLERIVLETARSGEWLELRVRLPADANTLASLQLKVPVTLREAELASESGTIEANRFRGRLRVETGAGAVSLGDVRGDVEVRTGGGPVELSRIAGSVRCFSGGGAITATHLGFDAELVTRGGEIRVREAGGKVRATTGGGNVRVERAGAVTAGTEGGLVEILDTAGPIVAETAQGPIRIRRAGQVRANSGAGRIELDHVSGSVHAATGLGNIVAAWGPQGPLADSLLSTPAGDITLLLPSNIAVTLEAEAGGGRVGIVSEFPEIEVRRL